jgi:Family of unknown function (DUF5989)
MTDKPSSEFEKAVSSGAAGNVLSDFWHFLRDTKKWWLLPIVILLLMLSGLLFLGGSAAAPFIYTLF